jgi:hypothetical protein
MVFNATVKNIWVISWHPVLLMEETEVPGENHWPVASQWQTNVKIWLYCHYVCDKNVDNLLYTMHVLFLVFKQINVYLCIFTIVWHLDIKRLMVGILIISLILYLCACSKPGTMISSAFFILFFMLTVN